MRIDTISTGIMSKDYKVKEVRFFTATPKKYYTSGECVIFSFEREVFLQEYKTANGSILAIFPSYVDVADLDEAEEELKKEFGEIVKE